MVYLDMTDNSATCPSGWQLTAYSKRTCGRVTAGLFICDSTIFPVYGEEHTQVCGRIKAYQFSRPNAFEVYDEGDVTTIDYAYMCRVSLTHGSPRQHTWTFANSHTQGDEANSGLSDHCPCETTYNVHVPPFVGADYFCESAVKYGSSVSGQFYQNDPLWIVCLAACVARSILLHTSLSNYQQPPLTILKLGSVKKILMMILQ